MNRHGGGFHQIRTHRVSMTRRKGSVYTEVWRK